MKEPTAIATNTTLALRPNVPDQAGRDLSMATHDVALAVAAKASALRVVGA